MVRKGMVLLMREELVWVLTVVVKMVPLISTSLTCYESLLLAADSWLSETTTPIFISSRLTPWAGENCSSFFAGKELLKGPMPAMLVVSSRMGHCWTAGCEGCDQFAKFLSTPFSL